MLECAGFTDIEVVYHTDTDTKDEDTKAAVRCCLAQDEGEKYLRFCFAKEDAVLAEVCQRLSS